MLNNNCAIKDPCSMPLTFWFIIIIIFIKFTCGPASDGERNPFVKFDSNSNRLQFPQKNKKEYDIDEFVRMDAATKFDFCLFVDYLLPDSNAWAWFPLNDQRWSANLPCVFADCTALYAMQWALNTYTALKVFAVRHSASIHYLLHCKL